MKSVQGQGAPSWPVNAALLVIKVQVDGVWCSVLIDTGCSQLTVSADQCMAWSSQQKDMRTIDGTSWACCGIGTMSIFTDGGGQAEVNVLVACEGPLGYNLLIEIDVIRVLGGIIIIIMPARDMKLGGGKEADVALRIDESDFYAFQP